VIGFSERDEIVL